MWKVLEALLELMFLCPQKDAFLLYTIAAQNPILNLISLNLYSNFPIFELDKAEIALDKAFTEFSALWLNTIFHINISQNSV